MKPVDLTESEVERGWADLSRSVFILPVIHNLLLNKIESYRSGLESASPGEVVQLQERIRAARELLHTIHEKDSKEQRTRYE